MSRKMRWRIYGIALMLYIGSGAGAHAQERLGPYTLDDAVHLALRLNEDVLVAEKNVEKAEGRMKSARSEALPNLSLNGWYARNWRVPTSIINGTEFRFGSTNILTGSASLSIPLYRGGRLTAMRRSAYAFREAEASRLTEIRQQVTFETERAFYGVLLADELVHVNQSALERAEAHVRQVTQLNRAGKASDYEALRARVQVVNLKPAVIAAENGQELAMLRLKNVIGVDLSMPLDIEGKLEDALAEQPPAGDDIDAAVRLALKNRPEITALSHDIEGMEEAVRVQASAKRPSVSLVNTYQNQAQVDDINALSTDRFVQSYSTQFVFDVPLFDGMRSRGAVQEARADLAAAGYTMQRRRKTVELEVREAFMRLQETREQLIAYRESIAETEKGLEIAEVRYRAGLGTQFEMLDARTLVTRAKTNYARGLNGYAVAVANLRRVTGVVK